MNSRELAKLAHRRLCTAEAGHQPLNPDDVRTLMLAELTEEIRSLAWPLEELVELGKRLAAEHLPPEAVIEISDQVDQDRQLEAALSDAGGPAGDDEPGVAGGLLTAAAAAVGTAAGAAAATALDQLTEREPTPHKPVRAAAAEIAPDPGDRPNAPQPA